MFNHVTSHYGLKKALKHELDKIGLARLGWDYESEMSHHLKKKNFEAVNIFESAIEYTKELRAKNVSRNHG